MSTGNTDLTKTRSEKNDEGREEQLEDLLADIKKAEKQAGMSIYIIGSSLKKVKHLKSQWTRLGSHVTSFDDVLKEIGYSPASGYNYIRIYETYLDYVTAKPDYCAIGYTKLVHLLPIMYEASGKPVDKETGQEHLESALLLATDKEVKGYIEEVRGKSPESACQHKEVTTHYKCNCCKQWVRSNQ